MDLSHRVTIKETLDLRQEIAIRITHILDATIAVQHHLDLAIEKALDQGVLQRTPDETRCPNCGTVFFGNLCPNCNQDLQDPELLDHDSDVEEHEGEDLSDSEDADDIEETTGEPEETGFEPNRFVSFAECLEGCLRDCGVDDKDLSLFVFLVTELADLGNPIPKDLSKTVAQKAAKASGREISEIAKTWVQRPFDDRELQAIVEECIVQSSTYAQEPAQPSILLEIRKIRNDYVPLVIDRYEDIVVNTAAQNKWIPVGPAGQRFHGNLVLLRKAQKKEILYKILETIMVSRRDFLDAPDRNAALEILRTKPFQQNEVVKRHGIDKGIIARHFNDTPILTPHGLFILSALSRQEALEQEDMTVAGLQDIVKLAIEKSDQEGQFYSDRKIKGMIEAQGAQITERYVNKIRQTLGIPASRDRKKATKTQNI